MERRSPDMVPYSLTKCDSKDVSLQFERVLVMYRITLFMWCFAFSYNAPAQFRNVLKMFPFWNVSYWWCGMSAHTQYLFDWIKRLNSNNQGMRVEICLDLITLPPAWLQKSTPSWRKECKYMYHDSLFFRHPYIYLQWIPVAWCTWTDMYMALTLK